MISINNLMGLISDRIDNYTYVEYFVNNIDSNTIISEPYFLLERILVGKVDKLLTECENTIRLFSIEVENNLNEFDINYYKDKLFKLIIGSIFLYILSPETEQIINNNLKRDDYVIGLYNIVYEIIDIISPWFNLPVSFYDFKLNNGRLIVNIEVDDIEYKLRLERVINGLIRLIGIIADEIINDTNVRKILKDVYNTAKLHLDNISDDEIDNTEFLTTDTIPVLIEYSDNSILITLLIVELI